jgi:hypothetical protein
VRYDGLRLLETVTDEPPAVMGGLAGSIVTGAGVLREFPPQALAGRTVRRIGLIGRAPLECELHVQLVEPASGKAIGPPARLTIAPAPAVTTHWVELPEHAPIALPVNLSVLAVKGRFLWVAGADPLTRVVIYDPDYAGRDVTLGGAPLSVPTGAMETHQAGFAFPKPAFVSQTPALGSNLFLTVDIADLTLRYAR